MTLALCYIRIYSIYIIISKLIYQPNTGYCLVWSADNCGEASHQISQQDLMSKRTENNLQCPYAIEACIASRDLVTVTPQCFELLILSQIRDIALIPDTSWSYCRGISVVLLINQTSAASWKYWRTGRLSDVRYSGAQLQINFFLGNTCSSLLPQTCLVWGVSVAVPLPGNHMLCLWKKKILSIFKSFKISHLFKDFPQQEWSYNMWFMKMQTDLNIRLNRDTEVDFGALIGQSSYFSFWVRVWNHKTSACFQKLFVSHSTTVKCD